jgi:hypothetical protein
MAKQNDLTQLLAKIARQSSRSQSSRSGSTRLPAIRESRSDTWGNTAKAHAIQFGRPSTSRSTTSTSSNGWDHLLSQGARSGLSSLFGGSILQGVGGLGGIVSGLFGLFGTKKKSPPPLTLFSLPSTHNEYVSFSSGGTAQASKGPIYTATHANTLQYHSAEIAQAVKHALLTSSSLNDVIAEL